MSSAASANVYSEVAILTYIKACHAGNWHSSPQFENGGMNHGSPFGLGFGTDTQAR